MRLHNTVSDFFKSEEVEWPLKKLIFEALSKDQKEAFGMKDFKE